MLTLIGSHWLEIWQAHKKLRSLESAIGNKIENDLQVIIAAIDKIEKKIQQVESAYEKLKNGTFLKCEDWAEEALGKLDFTRVLMVQWSPLMLRDLRFVDPSLVVLVIQCDGLTVAAEKWYDSALAGLLKLRNAQSQAAERIAYERNRPVCQDFDRRGGFTHELASSLNPLFDQSLVCLDLYKDTITQLKTTMEAIKERMIAHRRCSFST
ncbi:MAG: hypothetical protein ACYCS1_07940 [Gammaproteobacteria bacterium]